MNDTEIIVSMVKFMKQSNEIFTRMAIEMNNLKVDVEKLKKHQLPRIIMSRPNIVDAVGREYKLDNGGNGEYKSG